MNVLCLKSTSGYFARRPMSFEEGKAYEVSEEIAGQLIRSGCARPHVPAGTPEMAAITTTAPEQRQPLRPPTRKHA